MSFEPLFSSMVQRTWRVTSQYFHGLAQSLNINPKVFPLDAVELSVQAICTTIHFAATARCNSFCMLIIPVANFWHFVMPCPDEYRLFHSKGQKGSNMSLGMHIYLVNWPRSLCHVYMHLSEFYSHFQLYVWVWKFTRFLKTKSAFLSRPSEFYTTDDLFLFISIMLQFYLETFTGKIKLCKKHPLPIHIQIRQQAWTEFHFNSTKTTKWKKKNS